MPRIKIDTERCKGCELCIIYCPKKLIKPGNELNQKGLHTVRFLDGANCTGCSFCATMCPEVCIEVFK